MPATPTSDMEQETLRKIRLLASSIVQDFSAYERPVNSPDSSLLPLIPDLDLTFPSDILSPILNLDIPISVRREILQRLNRFLSDLQKKYISAYKEACLVRIRGNTFDSDLGSVHRLYLARFQQRCFPLARSQVSFVLSEVATYQRPKSSDAKRPFNTEYIPVLEKYFELNGYPSVSHRSILAQKSSMTPRQIEVWFQNHRKRSRQDGKVVQRLDSDFPLKRALSVLPKNTQSYQLRLLTPSDDGTISDDADEIIDKSLPKACELGSVLEETNKTAEWDKIRPPHAFPETRKSPYDDPFPNDNGVFRFPPPIWRRKPATTPIIPTEVDMDDFARTFHMKLNFINGPWKRESTPSKSDLPSFTPWFAPSRTIPSIAPLPALIRTRAPPPATSIMLSLTLDPAIFDFEPKSEKEGISCVVKLPYGPVPSVTDLLVPASEAPRRNLSPLPRRTPNGPTPSTSSSTNLLTPPGEAPRRKVSPLPRRAPSKSQSFGSRTSSFSSDISYSSSSSDDSSPSPSTPPPLPNQTLPEFEVLMQSEEPTNILDDYSQIFDFSSQTFDFTFLKSSNDQPSALLNSPDPLFQAYTPLIPTF